MPARVYKRPDFYPQTIKNVISRFAACQVQALGIPVTRQNLRTAIDSVYLAHLRGRGTNSFHIRHVISWYDMREVVRYLLSNQNDNAAIELYNLISIFNTNVANQWNSIYQQVWNGRLLNQSWIHMIHYTFVYELLANLNSMDNNLFLEDSSANMFANTRIDISSQMIYQTGLNYNVVLSAYKRLFESIGWHPEIYNDRGNIMIEHIYSKRAFNPNMEIHPMDRGIPIVEENGCFVLDE